MEARGEVLSWLDEAASALDGLLRRGRKIDDVAAGGIVYPVTVQLLFTRHFLEHVEKTLRYGGAATAVAEAHKILATAAMPTTAPAPAPAPVAAPVPPAGYGGGSGGGGGGFDMAAAALMSNGMGMGLPSGMAAGVPPPGMGAWQPSGMQSHGLPGPMSLLPLPGLPATTAASAAGGALDKPSWMMGGDASGAASSFPGLLPPSADPMSGWVLPSAGGMGAGMGGYGHGGAAAPHAHPAPHPAAAAPTAAAEYDYGRLGAAGGPAAGAGAGGFASLPPGRSLLFGTPAAAAEEDVLLQGAHSAALSTADLLREGDPAMRAPAAGTPGQAPGGPRSAARPAAAVAPSVDAGGAAGLAGAKAAPQSGAPAPAGAHAPAVVPGWATGPVSRRSPGDDAAATVGAPAPAPVAAPAIPAATAAPAPAATAPAPAAAASRMTPFDAEVAGLLPHVLAMLEAAPSRRMNAADVGNKLQQAGYRYTSRLIDVLNAMRPHVGVVTESNGRVTVLDQRRPAGAGAGRGVSATAAAAAAGAPAVAPPASGGAAATLSADDANAFLVAVLADSHKHGDVLEVAELRRLVAEYPTHGVDASAVLAANTITVPVSATEVRLLLDGSGRPSVAGKVASAPAAAPGTAAATGPGPAGAAAAAAGGGGAGYGGSGLTAGDYAAVLHKRTDFNGFDRLTEWQRRFGQAAITVLSAMGKPGTPVLLEALNELLVVSADNGTLTECLREVPCVTVDRFTPKRKWGAVWVPTPGSWIPTWMRTSLNVDAGAASEEEKLWRRLLLHRLESVSTYAVGRFAWLDGVMKFPISGVRYREDTARMYLNRVPWLEVRGENKVYMTDNMFALKDRGASTAAAIEHTLSTSAIATVSATAPAAAATGTLSAAAFSMAAQMVLWAIDRPATWIPLTMVATYLPPPPGTTLETALAAIPGVSVRPAARKVTAAAQIAPRSRFWLPGWLHTVLSDDEMTGGGAVDFVWARVVLLVLEDRKAVTAGAMVDLTVLANHPAITALRLCGCPPLSEWLPALRSWVTVVKAPADAKPGSGGGGSGGAAGASATAFKVRVGRDLLKPDDDWEPEE
jgi:hypothetical protein